MELDEYSNDSTISYISESPNDCNFIYDTEEYTYTPKIGELEPTINNITSSVNFGYNLNIKNLALKTKNAEYNSNKSSTLILKSKNTNVTATIFPSGKMICTGAKSEKESKSACIKFSKIVKKAGFNAELKDFKIQNITASFDVKFKISLPTLYNKINSLINDNSKKIGLGSYCKYNKNEFPGIIFYIDESKINLLIFESGKIVISGAKKRKEINDAFKIIFPLLIEAKNNN
jgi:transcription initiation factor TFIID TATA-box-binding protein